MSRVLLLAAEKPLPLLEPHGTRTLSGGGVTVAAPGFSVSEHTYYQAAVEALGFAMMPFRAELDLIACEDDLRCLTAYIRESFSPGEALELWSLWVGDGGGERPRVRRCALRELDMKTLRFLCEPQYEPDYTGDFPEGLISQICLTVTV